MKKKGIWLVAVLVVLLLPFISYGEVVQPELNRTYPYSTHLTFEISGMPAALESCNLTLTWAGDNSTHGDWVYPEHTYETLETSCGSAEAGTYYFDVDFDGLYYINFTHANDSVWAQNSSSFYVDREEVDGSKVIGAILYPILLLLVCFFLYKIGNSLDKEHFAISILYSLTALIIMPFSIHICHLVLNEYVKLPVLAQSYETLLVVLLWGILYVTGAYLMLMFIIKLVKNILSIRKIRRGDPNHEF